MGKKRILIIDDDKFMCDIVKSNLEKTGEYEVVAVMSGNQGIAKVKESDYDLVITDLLMAEMSGRQVLNAVKEMKPHIPVLLCSSYYDGQVRSSHPDLNKADGHISKPFDTADLRAKVWNLINKTR